MRRVPKVVAYIVKDDRIAVFRHADDPNYEESGLQVPAGTVQAGETTDEAVLREAYEETNLPGLRIVGFLGVAEYDMRPAQDVLALRHFYHLTTDADVPEEWETVEDDQYRFAFRWVPLRNAHAVGAGQTALLGRIFD